MAEDHVRSRTAMRRHAPLLPASTGLPVLLLAGSALLARKAAFSASTQRAWSAALPGSRRSMPRAARGAALYLHHLFAAFFKLTIGRGASGQCPGSCAALHPGMSACLEGRERAAHLILSVHSRDMP